MATLNRPDRLTLDAFSDQNRQAASYSRFTNSLKNPLIGVKGVQLVNANFVNSTMPLNDSSQLMFFYYTSATQASIRTQANLRCIRLYPSTFVPYGVTTAFVTNKYWNTGTELAAALTAAAATGGDTNVFNPIWVANQVSFSFDTATRKFSILANGTNYVAPAAADDPFVLDQLRGTTNSANRIKMNAFDSSNTYATGTFQPFQEGISMNARLGFTLAFNARGLWWGSTSQQGCATATGVPSNSSSVAVAADTFPILLGSQNVGVYLSISTGGGVDSYGRKNLIASIPIENAPLAINSYTTNSVEIPSLSTPNEIYEVTVELIDDSGSPFLQGWNYNTQIALALYY